ncbi:MAG: diguanylate cyclase [Spirochaetales bacterium]|nr:diguanylate cyclase [Spirochaetales bacterium]
MPIFIFADTLNPKVISGVLDLRGHSFSGRYLPDGEWSFRLLAIDGEPVENPQNVFLYVPGSWDDLTRTPYAEGEYTLEVLLPEKGPPAVGIMFPELSQVLEVKVDGNIIFSSGDFISGKTTYTKFISPVPVGEKFTITVRLRNTVFRSGGLNYLPLFGPCKSMRNYRELKIWIEAFYIGLLFIVAVYHLFIFLRNYSNLSALYLGLAAFFMMLRGVVVGENTITFIIPDFSWALDFRIEYISAYLISAAVLLFSNKIFPFKHTLIDFLIKLFIPLMALFSIITLFLPLELLSRTVYILNVSILSSYFVCAIIFIHALLERKEASPLFFIGGMISLAFYLVDAFYYFGETSILLNLSQLGMVLFILCQTLVLTRLYGDAFQRAETLTLSLEMEVKKQTAELMVTNESLHEEINYRKKIEKRLQKLSTTDPLTGAANRLKIDKDLEQCHNVFLRYGKSYGIVMFDLDHFKDVNDNYGHQVGDVVLKEIVKITQRVIRESDILARWGGEEFLVLMPMMEIDGTLKAAERIRAAFESCQFSVAGRVTASFGVISPDNEKDTLKELLIRMDQNLYKAKSEGRNKVVC